MLPDKFAFVDIETTGMRSFFDRIIEIGIIRVEDNEITQTYHSLINPQAHLPAEITMLTGITAGDLENAPTFRSIKQDILETLIDCVFVAHNVRFDYSFIKNEFQRENISFTSRQLCTVRLSRHLYPMHRRHNLDAIIERFHFPMGNRHRALDDARVLFHFYQKIQTEFPPEHLIKIIEKGLKKPSLPPKLSPTLLEKLPEQPGVYIFHGENGAPLYVGKSKNIRNRVLDHFSSDIHSPTEMKISQQIENIETITTAGELGALFLESKMIKQLLPLYNKKSRIKKELVGIKNRINKQGYHEYFLEPLTTIPTESLTEFVGIFTSRKRAKDFLTVVAKKYSLCEKLLGLEKTNGACFAYRLDRCKGACVNQEQALIYNLRCLAAFAANKIQHWPFDGAIAIEECAADGKKEYLLIDKWCYLGTIYRDEHDNKKNNLLEEIVFDLDIYQILKQYFKSERTTQKIHVLSSEEYATMYHTVD